MATFGDNAMPSGSPSDFTSYYAPTWGRHTSRTWPSAGNHDYGTVNASGYFGYFGSIAGPGYARPGAGSYYSYNHGAWHVVVLDMNVAATPGSTQMTWLANDLAATSPPCTLAYWHQPRFSSGSKHASDGTRGLSDTAWRLLYAAGGDVVLNGHEHMYERFAPQTPDAAADTTGIQEFVVGTGGDLLSGVGTVQPKSKFRDNTSWGVMKLTLGDTSYTAEFVAVDGTAGGRVLDSTTRNCFAGRRDAPGATRVSDAFSRTVTGGWASAPVGGAYTLNGTASDFSVNGSVGRIRGTTGKTRTATLRSVSARDTSAVVTVTPNKIATGGGQYVRLSSRDTSTGQYRVQARLLPGGSMSLALQRVLGSTTTDLAQTTVSGVTYAAGTALALRLETSGTSPTTLRARIWRASATEPRAWQVTAIDSNPIGTAGGVSVGTYMSGSTTNSPVTHSFDNLTVTNP